MKIFYKFFEALPSTNSWAKSHADSFADELTVISADMQTAGRGQFGRKWLSSEGSNLTASLCFFAPQEKCEPLRCTHLAAMAIIETLEEYEISSTMKWPNDIFVNQKKIAGILCETMQKDSSYFLVVGIGLNVNMPKEACEKIDQEATSLFIEKNQLFSSREVLKKICENFLQKIDCYLEKGFDSFNESFQARLAKSNYSLIID